MGVIPSFCVRVNKTLPYFNIFFQIGTVYQLVITITILLSQVLGLESVLGTTNGWQWLFVITAIPAVIQCCTLPLCPESPKYLLLNRGAELHAQRGEIHFAISYLIL